MAAIANDSPDSVILRIKSNNASTETPSDEKTPTPNKNGKISSIAKYRSITENLKKFLKAWNGGRLGGELRLRELVAISRNQNKKSLDLKAVTQVMLTHKGVGIKLFTAS